ncbi:hypothetical protein GU90_14095 [Saccharopolyspora rectivirgula]|uniref:Uncharacterized protein n=1 Tax=Saccharopolyspora rectivirgula TaxID=28042 RepID=A0A073AVD9_9PSEU|nr:hypothetical protein GU90_14095 [Saccharopolyspora rectivirgula]
MSAPVRSSSRFDSGTVCTWFITAPASASSSSATEVPAGSSPRSTARRTIARAARTCDCRISAQCSAPPGMRSASSAIRSAARQPSPG